ncbi:MAG: hypothetical protein HQK91_15160 [Nitrospirae bacterium]|nr:hypothetical protein [Nitrospirota bacterium]MBF0542771.1 hypothetical protein [Nitrospirota bacterium]
MRNQKNVTLSIGEVTIYEIQAKHIRKLIKGDINLDQSFDLKNPKNIASILDLIDPLIPELTSMTKEQFDELSLSDMLDVATTFMETNVAFFLEKADKMNQAIEAITTQKSTTGFANLSVADTGTV